MVSQLIDGITAVQLTEQILADLGILGIGIDAHALRSRDAEGSIIVLGYREYGKAYIFSELLGGLVHSTGYIGSRVQRTVVSKGSTVTYHGVDGIPGGLSQVLGSDLGGVGIVIDLLEEALQAFAVKYQLAFVVVVLTAQGAEYIQEVAAGAGTMGQTPGSGTLVLYFLAEIQELLPGELAVGHLGGQGFDLLIGPADFLQSGLIVVDHADRQVEGHCIGLAVHDVRGIDALYKVIGHQVGDIQHHAGLNQAGQVADREDIRTFAVLLGEDQVVGILAPVDAGVVGFKLDLEILALSCILFVQALASSQNRIGNGDEVHVVGNLQGNGTGGLFSAVLGSGAVVAAIGAAGQHGYCHQCSQSQTQKLFHTFPPNFCCRAYTPGTW